MGPLTATLVFFVILLVGFHVYEASIKARRDKYLTKIGDYMVDVSFDDHHKAAKLLERTNQDCLRLLEFMKRNYSKYTERQKKVVKAMLRGYNNEAFHENPPGVDGTSFTIEKGERYHFCMRQSNGSLMDNYNTFLFVVLHELAHVGNYWEYGHGPDFWRVFKFVTIEAVKLGIYKPVDYSKAPEAYCGLVVDYNPYFDKNLVVYQ